jgi:membrane-associated HD superfamily phosphohydrolase
MIILSMMGLAGLLLFFKSIYSESRNKINSYVVIAIIFVLLVFSLSRPSQRYLILLIPFFILMLPTNLLKSRFVLFSTLAIFISADIVIELSRYATGMASKNVADMLEVSSLLSVTDPGAIEGHQGGRVYSYRNLTKLYVVVPGDKSVNPDAILSSPPTSLLIKKSFSVVPLNPTHG